ncbi:MAG: putative 3-oxoadipate enol-lactonase [Cyanobacteria bacterium RYN_339]|nr:putative 3-oxoadipate enol-lactonase [Cyanobacteria bacterium RYN_339]
MLRRLATLVLTMAVQVSIVAALATRTVMANDLKIAYSEAGAGTPLVFIHGFPLNRHLWDAQVQDLAADHRVIAIDLPGFGDSQARGGSVTMDVLAADVHAVLQQLRVERPVIIGHSMGGFVSLAYAERYPQDLRGLVLVSTNAEASSEKRAVAHRALAEQVREVGAAPVIDAFAPLMGPAGALDPALDLRARALMATASRDGLASCLVGMSQRPERLKWLSTSTIPALVLTGTADQTIPMAASQRMAAVMSNAKLVALEGGGHLLPLERPARLTAEIRQFARTCPPTGGAE